ncbi:hypothetical protein B296_00051928 [Ensete ventricosum]|uniref:Secreted protein n=1 Tax=Ensete ventricosum TaxID=4639 RepID=A0A426YEN3_ENSVE|nr:hypothetical protein B296_00051928 [Ensete ventricosum]
MWAVAVPLLVFFRLLFSANEGQPVLERFGRPSSTSAVCMKQRLLCGWFWFRSEVFRFPAHRSVSHTRPHITAGVCLKVPCSSRSESRIDAGCSSVAKKKGEGCLLCAKAG